MNTTDNPREMYIPVSKLGVKAEEYAKMIETGQGYYDIKTSAKDADKIGLNDEGWLVVTIPAKGTIVMRNV